MSQGFVGKGNNVRTANTPENFDATQRNAHRIAGNRENLRPIEDKHENIQPGDRDREFISLTNILPQKIQGRQTPDSQAYQKGIEPPKHYRIEMGEVSRFDKATGNKRCKGHN